MALFPKATFEVLVPDGQVVAGGATRGILVVEVEEEIPRADAITLELRSTLHTRQPVPSSRQLFVTAQRVALPHVLKAGTHRFPFALETPAWLPPTFHDSLADIDHTVHVRLDVAWASDPEVDLHPTVVVPPREGHREPRTVRMPPSFHAQAVVDVTLDSTVLLQGEPLVGSVQVRGGTVAPFDGITVSLLREVGGGALGSWLGLESSLSIATDDLASGDPVPFELPAPERNFPTFRSGVLDHAAHLAVHLTGDFQSYLDRTHHVALEVLPHGSTIQGDPGGSTRLRRRSAHVAAATGLRQGQGSLLVVGEPGGLSLRITERSERFGAVLDISIRYPDLGLGLELQTTRSLQAVFGGATLPGFDHYRPVARTRAVPSAFFEALFEHAPPSAELRLSDEELGLRVPLHDDGFEHLVDEVLRAVARTERVATAIGALPFPADVPPAAQAAWRACAATSRAVLVPSVPSLSGFAFPRVTPAQEERTLTATLITVREREVMRDRVYVYLDASRLPERTLGPLLNGVYPPGLARVRETFPRMHATSNGEVITLERDTWSPDPRLLLPALEAVVDWVLVERGELRSGLPYR